MGMRVDRPATLERLPEIVAAWGLGGPSPVVVLVGGAGALEGDAGRSAAHAIDAELIPAVVAAGASLITGGTDAGVMRLAGERRRATDGRFPLIGVVPAGLVALPDGLDALGDAPARRASTTAQVQPDHTHVLAVPGDRWGAETPWLFTLAEALAAGRPVVTVALNGGSIARAEIAESVRRDIPVLVVQGTGRAADEIASALADGRPSREGDQDAALRESGLVQAVRFDEDGALRAALGRVLAPHQGSARMTQPAAAPPASGTGAHATPSYEEEMRSLIARMEITDEQRQFLRSRWLDQVLYMGDRASDAKRRYYAFRLTTVVGGVIVPALISISLAGAGRFDSNLDFGMRLLTFMVSAMVAVTASVEGFMHYGERWRHYRVNAELLKSEGWQYLTQSGGYRRITDPEQAFQGFASRVEEILRDDVDGFMTQVTRTSPIEKHDIFTKL
jgi:hypothetical protein